MVIVKTSWYPRGKYDKIKLIFYVRVPKLFASELYEEGYIPFFDINERIITFEKVSENDIKEKKKEMKIKTSWYPRGKNRPDVMYYVRVPKIFASILYEEGYTPFFDADRKLIFFNKEEEKEAEKEKLEIEQKKEG